jgi:iron(II)-dependent oxidoreductase
MVVEKQYHSAEMFDWVEVPGGPALVGADFPGEGPPRLVNIRGFLISRYAVSNEDFQSFIADGGYHRVQFWEAEGLLWRQSGEVTEPAFWRDRLFNLPEQPVTGVSYYEAQAYASWAGAKLPTELQWEKAARGTHGASYPWGEDEPDASRANFAPGFVPVRISPIPIRECPDGDSPYGCRQMAGNVYEWCLDFFQADTPSRRADDMLYEGRPSRRRVLKGGSWGSGSSRLRTSARWSGPPELRDNILGFRLIRDLDRSA